MSKTIMLEIVILIFIVVFAIGFYQKSTNAVCKSKKRLDGKTVIVTGGTAGIGLEISIDLARRGARTIVACPFKNEGEDAKVRIIKKSGNVNVVYTYLDLSSLKSIRIFANNILAAEARVDILINNAGVGAPTDVITEDGMNFIMQVNYFGAFLLTLLLLPLLKKSGTPLEPSRIINTSSVLHWLGTFNPDILRKPHYSITSRYYPDSKLCLILFTMELSKRLQGSNIVVNSVDPGAVGTHIFRSINNVCGLIITYAFQLLFKTPWQGAQTSLHVALDRKVGEVTGKFFKNCQLSRPKAQAIDNKVAKQLWEESLRMVKLNDSDLVKCFNA